MHFRILNEFLECLTQKMKEQYWAGFGPGPRPIGVAQRLERGVREAPGKV
jgi:hypothetical protein